MDHPDHDYLVVTDPETDKMIAIETTDEHHARNMAWKDWFGDEPVDERVRRFTLRPAVGAARLQPTTPAHELDEADVLIRGATIRCLS